jgi:hypothetical protein
MAILNYLNIMTLLATLSFAANAYSQAAKDTVSVEDFSRVENQSEDKLDKVRKPAQKLAQALLK